MEKFPDKLKIKMFKKKLAYSLQIEQSEPGLILVTKINLTFAMKFLFQSYCWFFNRYIKKKAYYSSLLRGKSLIFPCIMMF